MARRQDRTTVEDIVDLSRQLMRYLHTATVPDWIQLELTMAQFKALIMLAAEGPITIGTLGQRLGIHLPAASHVTDRLVQLDLVERYEDTEDRRRTFARLTERGRTMVDELQAGRYERMRSLLSVASDDDLEALERGLKGLLEAAKRELASRNSEAEETPQ
jgi:DNA-binding MarR family transcriptional regulator